MIDGLDELHREHTTGDPGLNEAQERTRSYVHRHSLDMRTKYGVWRWRGLYDLRVRVLHAVTAGRTIDFGGALAPLGLGSEIVDPRKVDLHGNPVPYRTIGEVRGTIDCFFASHSLDHVANPDRVLRAAARRLRPGGTMVLHLSEWTCDRWCAHMGDHATTYFLAECMPPEDYPRAYDLALGVAVLDDMDVVVAERVGDNSVYVEAVKR